MKKPSTYGMEPKQRCNVDDYVVAFKKYVKDINEANILERCPPEIDIENSSGQDYFLVNADTEQKADAIMQVFSLRFNNFILDNKILDKDIFGYDIGALARINYEKHDPNKLKPILLQKAEYFGIENNLHG
ncbi:TPA: hypothetical protein HA363_05445 [Candidatus Woesearchaeota archaeon]|nr:hypothetical protein [Candidatus Woesearchaeota archaeon]